MSADRLAGVSAAGGDRGRVAMPIERRDLPPGTAELLTSLGAGTRPRSRCSRDDEFRTGRAGAGGVRRGPKGMSPGDRWGSNLVGEIVGHSGDDRFAMFLRRRR